MDYRYKLSKEEVIEPIYLVKQKRIAVTNSDIATREGNSIIKKPLKKITFSKLTRWIRSSSA